MFIEKLPEEVELFFKLNHTLGYDEPHYVGYVKRPLKEITNELRLAAAVRYSYEEYAYFPVAYMQDLDEFYIVAPLHWTYKNKMSTTTIETINLPFNKEQYRTYEYLLKLSTNVPYIWYIYDHGYVNKIVKSNEICILYQWNYNAGNLGISKRTSVLKIIDHLDDEIVSITRWDGTPY